MEYYIIQQDTQVGPLSREQLIQAGLTAQTPVWRQGMADWKPAGELPELANLLYDAPASAPNTPPVLYYAMLHGVRVGPSSANDLVAAGLTMNTMVWCEGMADWAPAGTIPALQNALQRQQARPVYGTGSPTQGYSNNAQVNSTPIPHTNWMAWAITGTVLGLLTTCIGAIFGIIGIVQASKANDAYARGDAQQGSSANSTAKTMTIISLIFAGVGILAFMLSLAAGLFNVLAVLS